MLKVVIWSSAAAFEKDARRGSLCVHAPSRRIHGRGMAMAEQVYKETQQAGGRLAETSV